MSEVLVHNLQLTLTAFVIVLTFCPLDWKVSLLDRASVTYKRVLSLPCSVSFPAFIFSCKLNSVFNSFRPSRNKISQKPFFLQVLCLFARQMRPHRGTYVILCMLIYLGEKSIVAMLHLSWNLARNVKITERKLFEHIR